MRPARIQTVALTAITLLLAGCKPQIPTGSQREGEERDAREAVFRHQFKGNASGLTGGAGVYCLEIEQAAPVNTTKLVDPDDQLMRRFDAGPTLVRKSSSCESGELGVFDKETGIRGLMLQTGTIDWVSGDELQVEGGYYEGPLSASRNLYRLKKVRGTWVVVQDTLALIS